MTALPAVTGKELVAALKKGGPGLLAKVLRDCNLGRDDLHKLL